MREKCVFTTHTPVAAGNDSFAPETMLWCFGRDFIAELKISEQEFFALGRSDLSNDEEFFGMTPFALRMCRSANGVSAKHGQVSRGLWHKMFPQIGSESDVPI